MGEVHDSVRKSSSPCSSPHEPTPTSPSLTLRTSRSLPRPSFVDLRPPRRTNHNDEALHLLYPSPLLRSPSPPLFLPTVRLRSASRIPLRIPLSIPCPLPLLHRLVRVGHYLRFTSSRPTGRRTRGEEKNGRAVRHDLGLGREFRGVPRRRVGGGPRVRRTRPFCRRPAPGLSFA